MVYSAVIFDLDGTLVDSADDIAEAVNLTLDDLRLPRFDGTTVRGWIGEGVRNLVAAALQASRSTVPLEQVMPGFLQHYQACLLRSPRLYPGVVDALDMLQQRGVPMAICTNKPYAMVPPLLMHLGVERCFAQVLGGDSLPQRKPDPAPLLHLASGFGLMPAQCLMVGDSATDAGAAQAAHMPLALVRYGYRRELDLESAGAVRVVDSLTELLDLA